MGGAGGGGAKTGSCYKVGSACLPACLAFVMC
jgi:hypothetical protein